MHQLQKKIITLLVLAGTLSISACGWHLRGSEPLPEEMQTLYLSIANENSDLSRSLKRSLKTLGVTLTEKSADAPLTLAITNVDNQRRTVSTSSRGKAAEYELTTFITYELKNKQGETLFGPDTVSAEKIYLFDPNQVVSAFEEEQLLRQEMQRDLIQQLIRRYQASRTAAPEAS
ncbi:MAG: hypothetical protein K9K86_06700 [Pseudomonadales bacterium]|nr:hypothetical protein [Pseudomonadales bacterium]